MIHTLGNKWAPLTMLPFHPPLLYDKNEIIFFSSENILFSEITLMYTHNF